MLPDLEPLTMRLTLCAPAARDTDRWGKTLTRFLSAISSACAVLPGSLVGHIKATGRTTSSLLLSVNNVSSTQPSTLMILKQDCCSDLTLDLAVLIYGPTHQQLSDIVETEIETLSRTAKLAISRQSLGQKDETTQREQQPVRHHCLGSENE